LSEASNAKLPVPKPAAHAALFFYFAFSPCYNIGNNAITYSNISPVILPVIAAN
jgi:hypothetical protein